MSSLYAKRRRRDAWVEEHFLLSYWRRRRRRRLSNGLMDRIVTRLNSCTTSCDTQLCVNYSFILYIRFMSQFSFCEFEFRISLINILNQIILSIEFRKDWSINLFQRGTPIQFGMKINEKVINRFNRRQMKYRMTI